METNNFTDDRSRMQTIHFNRAQMQRGSDFVWTIHNAMGCFQVKRVSFFRPFTSHYQKEGRQPRAQFKGLGKLQIKDGEAFIR